MNKELKQRIYDDIIEVIEKYSLNQKNEIISILTTKLSYLTGNKINKELKKRIYDDIIEILEKYSLEHKNEIISVLTAKLSYLTDDELVYAYRVVFDSNTLNVYIQETPSLGEFIQLEFEIDEEETNETLFIKK